MIRRELQLPLTYTEQGMSAKRQNLRAQRPHNNTATPTWLNTTTDTLCSATWQTPLNYTMARFCCPSVQTCPDISLSQRPYYTYDSARQGQERKPDRSLLFFHPCLVLRYRTHNESLPTSLVVMSASSVPKKKRNWKCYAYHGNNHQHSHISILQVAPIVLSASVIHRTSRSMPVSMCKLLQGVHHADGSRVVASKTKEGDRGNAVAAHNFEKAHYSVWQENSLHLCNANQAWIAS